MGIIVRLFGLAFVLVIGAAASPKASAWGELGHLTVCDLAYRNLTDTSKTALKQIFNAPHGVTVNLDGSPRTYTSFNVGCLEEDERPRVHPADHFLNVARSLPAITAGACPLTAAGNPSKCIFAGITRDMDILKDGSRPRQERVIALMAIGHWVGDIHQPLHISYKDDTGGNGIKVRFSGQCGRSVSGNPYRPANLHAVWDNCLLQNGIFERVRQRADFKTTWSRRTITYRAVDTLQANTSAAERRLWTSTEPWQWAAESYAITRRPDVEYCVMVGNQCQYTTSLVTLPGEDDEKTVVVRAAYLDMFKDIAGERVRQAGIRLAHLINLALDPAYRGP